jgi:hypothetical protein
MDMQMKKLILCSLVTTDILAKDAVIRKQFVNLSDQICSNVTLFLVYSQINKQ